MPPNRSPDWDTSFASCSDAISVRITLWFVGIVGARRRRTAASIIGLYDTQAELDQYGQLVEGNAALIVQAGPGYGLATPTTGSVLMNETEIWTVIAVALMSMFMMVRHTRTEEENECAELVRAAPVGRHTPMLAALIGVAVANLLIAVGVADLGAGVRVTRRGIGGVRRRRVFFAGLLYAAVAATAAQVASSARSALALGGVVLAAVVRPAGSRRRDGDDRLSWLSPLGWAQAIRAFADERWWVVGLPIVATCALVSCRGRSSRPVGTSERDSCRERPGAPKPVGRSALPSGSPFGCSGHRSSPGPSAWASSGSSTASSRIRPRRSSTTTPT